VFQDVEVFRRVLPSIRPPPFVSSKKKIAANDAEAKKMAEVPLVPLVLCHPVM
jgi:hypothetical protein